MIFAELDTHLAVLKVEVPAWIFLEFSFLSLKQSMFYSAQLEPKQDDISHIVDDQHKMWVEI